jgi:hypothetical protein
VDQSAVKHEWLFIYTLSKNLWNTKPGVSVGPKAGRHGLSVVSFSLRTRTQASLLRLPVFACFWYKKISSAEIFHQKNEYKKTTQSAYFPLFVCLHLILANNF